MSQFVTRFRCVVIAAFSDSFRDVRHISAICCNFRSRCPKLGSGVSSENKERCVEITTYLRHGIIWEVKLVRYWDFKQHLVRRRPGWWKPEKKRTDVNIIEVMKTRYGERNKCVSARKYTQNGQWSQGCKCAVTLFGRVVNDEALKVEWRKM